MPSCSPPAERDGAGGPALRRRIGRFVGQLPGWWPRRRTRGRGGNTSGPVPISQSPRAAQALRHRVAGRARKSGRDEAVARRERADRHLKTPSAQMARSSRRTRQPQRSPTALPFSPRIIALYESRVRMEDVDSQKAAGELTAVTRKRFSRFARSWSRALAAPAQRAGRFPRNRRAGRRGGEDAPLAPHGVVQLPQRIRSAVHLVDGPALQARRQARSGIMRRSCGKRSGGDRVRNHGRTGAPPVAARRRESSRPFPIWRSSSRSRRTR